MERPDTVDQAFVASNNTPDSWKIMSEDKILMLLNTPCNIIISSPSQGGKSTFVYRLLKHDMFREPPEKILYALNLGRPLRLEVYRKEGILASAIFDPCLDNTERVNLFALTKPAGEITNRLN